jgi:hypothetical protein
MLVRTSPDYLQKILELAKEVTVAVRADDEGRLDDLTPGLLPDPHIGALTQIFREYAPGGPRDRVVLDIDEIVRQVRFSAGKPAAQATVPSAAKSGRSSPSRDSQARGRSMTVPTSTSARATRRDAPLGLDNAIVTTRNVDTPSDARPWRPYVQVQQSS